MDKLDFVINNQETIKIAFQKQDLEILPYIPENVKLNLSKQYIEFAFSSEDVVDNYYQSEWAMLMGIVEGCTNIKLNEKNFDNIIQSGLWDIVKHEIKNYEEFKNNLRQIYQNELNKRSLEKSFGKSFDKIANGILEFLDKIGEVDLSQEGVSKLLEGLKSETSNLEDKFPGITGEVKVKKTRKPRAKKIKE